MSQQKQDVSYVQDLCGKYAEFLPEIVLPLIDIVLMSAYGHGNEITGVSVFHLTLFCMSRLIMPWNETVGEFASQSKRKRTQFLALGMCSVPIILLFGTIMFLSLDRLEDFLGLPGFSSYGMITVFGWVWIRMFIPIFQALSIHKICIKERVVLAWGISIVNAVLTWIFLHNGGGSFETGLATFIAELGYGFSAYWAFKNDIFRLPKTEDFDESFFEMLRFYKVKLVGQVFKIIATVSAIFLNKWLGPELGKHWVWIQETNRTIITLGNIAWETAARHYRDRSEEVENNKFEPTELSHQVWAQGTWVGWCAVGIGSCVALFISPLGVLCTTMGAGGTYFKCRRQKGKILEDAKIVRKGEIANSLIMILGYFGIYLTVAPSLWVAILIYALAHSMRIVINK